MQTSKLKKWPRPSVALSNIAHSRNRTHMKKTILKAILFIAPLCALPTLAAADDTRGEIVVPSHRAPDAQHQARSSRTHSRGWVVNTSSQSHRRAGYVWVAGSWQGEHYVAAHWRAVARAHDQGPTVVYRTNTHRAPSHVQPAPTHYRQSTRERHQVQRQRIGHGTSVRRQSRQPHRTPVRNHRRVVRTH